jgi:hypothetical protein
MSDKTSNLQIILTPIIRYCMRHSLGLQELIDSAKLVYLHVAEEELERAGQKVTISRLSVATGVHRKDAARIFKEGELPSRSDRLTDKVINQWRRDKQFQTKNKRPRTLTFKGEDSEFAELVAAVSADLKPGTVLFDLERIEAVKKTSKGLTLLTKAYIPPRKSAESYELLAEDAEDLFAAVFENIDTETEELPNYHAKAVYDNIAYEDLPKIRKWLFQQSSKFHARVMKFLSQYDLDINPTENKTGGARVALGIFSKTPPKEKE